MKKYAFLFLLSLLGSYSFAQNKSSIEKSIEKHFEDYTPELFRYSGLTSYGESQSTFSKQQIDSELRILENIKAKKLFKNSSQNMFALFHNIIIHSPASGKEIITALNQPTENEEIINFLLLEFIAMGEEGEKYVIKNIQSTTSSWSKLWVNNYYKNFIYDLSLETIEKIIKNSKDEKIQSKLIYSLMYIGSPKSRNFVKSILDSTKSDKIMMASMFVYGELVGYNSIEYLKSIKPVGESSIEEQKLTVEWLKKNTTPENLYGTEVGSDFDFIRRFGDIKSPAIIWAEKEGLLNEKSVKTPVKLSKSKKDELLVKLIESKGFGLEAIKGSLFLSIEKSDLKQLLELRKLCFYSPNRFSQGRIKTIGILIRYLKKQK